MDAAREQSRAMAGTFPLVLLLLPLCLEGAPGLSLTHNCTAGNEIVVADGDEVMITSIKANKSKRDNVYGWVFVHPEPGFLGVSLLVTGKDGTQQAAWFPADSQCFPSDGKWLDVGVWAIAPPKDNINPPITGLRIRECRKECKYIIVQHEFLSLGVLARGPSRWSLTTPSNSCITQGTLPHRSSTLPTCSTPPPHVTPMEDSHTAQVSPLVRRLTVLKVLVVVAAAMTVLVAVVTVAGTVSIWRKSHAALRRPMQTKPFQQPLLPKIHSGTVGGEVFKYYYNSVTRDVCETAQR